MLVILGLDDEYVQCDFEVCFGFDDGIDGVYERLMIDRWYAKSENAPERKCSLSLYSKKMPKSADRWKIDLARRNLLAKW